MHNSIKTAIKARKLITKIKRELISQGVNENKALDDARSVAKKRYPNWKNNEELAKANTQTSIIKMNYY